MLETEETAKAVQEVAKTTNNVVDKTAELSRFVGKVVGPAIEDIGAIVKQYTEYWKLRNALSLNAKAEKILSERGYPQTTSLPLRIGLPLLDAAVTEDEESLQKLWANLLVSAMTENNVRAVTRTYIEVLKQLDSIDAELLNALFPMHIAAVKDENRRTYISTKGDRDIVQLSVAFNNLERVGLVKVLHSEESASQDASLEISFQQAGNAPTFKVHVSLTLFGFHLMRVCTDEKLEAPTGGEYLPIDDRFEFYPIPAKGR